MIYIPLLWLVVFLVGPLFLVAIMSLQKRGTYGGVEWVWNIDNFIRALEPIYLQIFLKSVSLAGFTALICLILSYPLAWAMVTMPARKRQTILFLLAIPFFTNLLIRIYAIKVFVGFDGQLILLLRTLGIEIDPYYLSQNIYLVMYGMVTTYLPFMIFPLYSAMDRLQFSLIEAAEDLGASQFHVLFKVLIPSTWMAALTGINLVFIPCLGEFLIPDLLGGAKTMLMGNLITEQFLKARDWPFGAALAMMLIFLLMAFILILKLLEKRKSA